MTRQLRWQLLSAITLKFEQTTQYDWGRRSSTLGETLGSKQKGLVNNHQDTQFIGFNSDKSR